MPVYELWVKQEVLQEYIERECDLVIWVTADQNPIVKETGILSGIHEIGVSTEDFRVDLDVRKYRRKNEGEEF